MIEVFPSPAQSKLLDAHFFTLSIFLDDGVSADMMLCLRSPKIVGVKNKHSYSVVIININSLTLKYIHDITNS